MRLRKFAITVMVFAVAFFLATVLNLGVCAICPNCHLAIVSGLIAATMVVLLLGGMGK